MLGFRGTRILVARLLPAAPVARAASDPLPSWNDGAAKRRIVEFVREVSDPSGQDYVPPAERVVVFDNDGTLWAEQPLYFQALFAIDRVRALAPQHPDWKEREPFASVLRGDVEGALAGGERWVVELIAATHAGMTTGEFEGIVRAWIATARHPKTGPLLTEMAYQPMQELLAYLGAGDFQTYIVSGGGVDFMRAWADRVYGLPPERVIGSTIRTRFELREGKSVLMRLPEVEFVDDGPGKPLAIHHRIGRRPIAAFGNSDGDREMLEWTTMAPGLRLGVIVHHTDAEREYAYSRQSRVGKLDEALDAAPERGWLVVSMKRDWARVFVGD